MKHRFRPLGPKARISTAVVATAVAAASAQVATASPVAAPESTDGPSLAESCTARQAILMGRYYLHNAWTEQGGEGRQCVRDTSSDDEAAAQPDATGPGAVDAVAWDADWQWPGATDGPRSTATAVFGWHWGWKTDDTGLPVKLSSGTPVTSQWDFTVSDRGGRLHAGYRLWLHEQATPGPEDQPHDEVAIWLHRSGGDRPLGGKRGTVAIDGVRWDLYQGGEDWKVHTFVRSDNTTSSDIDLTAFLAELTKRGAVSADSYLSGVEAGTEVSSGRGSLATESFAVNVG